MDSIYKMKPIGILKSVFHFKNGTPRQSSLCQAARGVLTIEKSIFNNPEHSLQGLEEFSHAWILFVFHKNNNTYTKAKVKPPRLDGQKVGVFATRSPYRPNNIGLSLVKIDKIDGPSIHLSGIDLLDGTPVLDIKPFIPEYDSPRNTLQHSELSAHDETSILDEQSKECLNHTGEAIESSQINVDQETEPQTTDVGREKTFCQQEEKTAVTDQVGSTLKNAQKEHVDLIQVTEGFYELSEALKKVGETLQCRQSNTTDDCDYSQVLKCIDLSTDSSISQNKCSESKKSLFNENSNIHHASPLLSHNVNLEELLNFDTDSVPNLKDKETISRETTSTLLELKSSVVAPWLTNPPVSKLRVSFTPRALEQLHQFSKDSADEAYRLDMLMNSSEAENSIAEILIEEPRSVYRRQNCPDNLYYFSLDTLHVTCWFDDDQVEVVRIKPVTLVPKLVQNFNTETG